jgi:hypothetical protein
MQYHILNGDALKQQFPTNQINGSLIICRECLIDGNIAATTLNDFWTARKQFLEQVYGAEKGKYEQYVLPEFKKILALPNNVTINLWFGDDLFCQMNLCFIIFLLNKIGIQKNIFLVKAQLNNWQEFGAMSKEELITAHQQRKRINSSEFQLMLDIWNALQQKDFKHLKILATSSTPHFPRLKEVMQAHMDRFPPKNKLGRPQQSLLQLQKELQSKDFIKIFPAFNEKEGIYGFGDLQVKIMFDELENSLL